MAAHLQALAALQALLQVLAAQVLQAARLQAVLQALAAHRLALVHLAQVVLLPAVTVASSVTGTVLTTRCVLTKIAVGDTKATRAVSVVLLVNHKVVTAV